MEFRSNKLEGTVNLVNDKDQEKNDCEKLREKRSCQNENLLIVVFPPSLRTTTSSDNKSQYWPRGAPKHAETAENEKA